MNEMCSTGARRYVSLDAKPVTPYASVTETGMHFVFHLVRAGARTFESDLVTELYSKRIAYVYRKRDSAHSGLLQVAEVLSRSSMAWGGVVLVYVT